MAPLVLLSPTVPWLACGFFFACSKSQSPGPALHLWAYQDPASPQRQVLADRCCPWAPVPSPPALLSCILHKSILACCVTVWLLGGEACFSLLQWSQAAGPS